MRHSILHKLDQTVKGVEFEFKVRAPESVEVKHVLARVRELFKTVTEDPNQLGLKFPEDNEGEDDEDEEIHGHEGSVPGDA